MASTQLYFVMPDKTPLMQYRTALIVVLASCAPALFAQRVTLAQFERDQKQVAEHVNNIIDAEFEHLEKALEDLAKPLAVGDTVKVEIRRGAARENVEGRFNGIVGKYVRISSNNILLNDVAEEQRDRFIIAQYPERREQIVMERREEIHEAKERARRKLRPTILRESGYGPDFFDENLRLGDGIFPKTALGSDKVYAVLIAVDGEKQMLCRVLNRAGVQGAVAAVLSDQGIGASGDEDMMTKPWGNQLSFYLPRSQFSNLTQFLKSFSLICHSERHGIWRLAALPQTKRKTSVIERNGAPTKMHQIMISFGLADYERGDMLTAQLAAIPLIDKQTFRRHVAEATVFQERLAEQRAEAEARAREAAEALALQKAAAAAAAGKAVAGATGGANAPAQLNAALKLDVVTGLVGQLAAEGLKIGPHPENAKSAAGAVGSVNASNHLAPQTVNGVAVFGGTQWQRMTPKVADGSKPIDFAEYRILVGNEGDKPATILQVSGMFASNAASISTFTASTLLPGEEKPLQATFQTPIDFVGKVFLYYRIPVEFAKKSIQDAQIGIEMVQP
jgi:hypothetical protein